MGRMSPIRPIPSMRDLAVEMILADHLRVW
jgi:hypothetical protein